MVFPSWSESAAVVDRLAPALLAAAGRSMVLLGLVGLGVLAMRRASAAARHWVWLLGFASLLLLPVLSATLPGWNILPRLAKDSSPPPPGPSLVTVAAPSIPVLPPLLAEPEKNTTPDKGLAATTGNESPTAGPKETTVVTAATPAGPEPSVNPPTISQNHVSSSTNSTPTASAAVPWTFWLALLWLIGSLLVLGHMILGHVSLWLLQRRCTRISQGDWPALLSRLCRMLNVRRGVELLSSPQRTMPMTWGLWRTRVLLPEQAAEWPAEQRKAVLLHELGHVRRCDCITQLVAQLACALYWFNPLVWIAWQRMQIERERACDDLVLNTGGRASAYAEHLLHSASGWTTAPTLRYASAAIAMARPSTLEERLRAILDGHRSRRGLTGKGALWMILLLLAALVPVAILRAQDNSTRSPAADVPLPPGYPAQGVPPPAGYPLDGVPLPPGYPAQGVPLPPGYAPQGTPPRDPAPARMDDVAPATPAPVRPAPPTPPTPPTAETPAAPPVGRSDARGPQAFSGGRGGGRGGTGGPGGTFSVASRGPVALGEGPTCSLDATIYDLRLPVDQIGRIDIDALKRASATPAEFEKALAALGTVQPLYRANQTVRLAHDTINISTQTPYITSSQTTAFGTNVNSVTYSQIGFILEFMGKPSAAGAIDLEMQIQLSTLNQSATAISAKVTAPMLRMSTLAHKRSPEPRQPIVLLNVDAASADADGKAVAYIARVTFGDLHSFAEPGRE